MQPLLGQLVPAPANQGLPLTEAREIRQMIELPRGLEGRRIEVLVTSKNALKMNAAKNSVVEWIKALFNQTVEVVAKGYAVNSDIGEQPYSLQNTKQGAFNRLFNLKHELSSKENISENTQDNVLRVLFSLENGIMREQVANLKNPGVFQTQDGTVWVDRCVAMCEIWLQGKRWSAEALSEGVTTPKAEAAKAEQANWSRTAGSFIAETYGWPSADWHGAIAGKGRELIMNELSKAALGIPPDTLSIPQVLRPYDPVRDKNIFLNYNTQMIELCTPVEIDNMLAKEIEHEKNNIPKAQWEDSKMWRGYYQEIPQPSKATAAGFERIKGPDGNLINNSGPVLTEDLLVGYFDTIVDLQTGEKRDVLHIVLLYAQEEEGWTMPGKRDRAYDLKKKDDSGNDIEYPLEELKKADMSIQDGNYGLVEKEIGVKRSHVVANIVLGCFDDRKREARMKTTSIVSFCLLDQKPSFIPGKRIGVPLNALVQLVQHEITIPPNTSSPREGKLLIRNHDSLILSVLKTAAFYSAMEKVKHAHVKFKELLRANPQANYPSLSSIDSSYECPICANILVDVRSVCRNGHDMCGVCYEAIAQANSCPDCRGALDVRENRSMEEVVKQRYPEQYAVRFKQIHNDANPFTWREDPAFNGNQIHYK